MILEILIVVALFLWFISLLPIGLPPQFSAASGWLAWIVALLIALFLFVPGIR